MALNSIIWHDIFGVCLFIFNLSNFKLMQEIITYVLIILAVVFLLKKFVFPSKKDKSCSTDCGCH
jgi:hypothetical protein